MNEDLIKKITSLNSSIEHDKESNIFTLKDTTQWLDICKSLIDDSMLKFDYLMCITSIDLESDGLGLSYNFHSTKLKHECEFRLIFSEGTEVPSVESIWKTADWHEREAFDMMGISFINHPNMKRILLPDDWEGHPLKKDYKVQDYYHGMYVPKDKTEWE